MADSTPKSYHTDPTLYLYTSLTSGSSHIISATSRMQTILKANRIEFQALDVATDEKARMLWGRRAGKRKLPGLVRFGMLVGDLEEVEEWNEYGELKENVNLPSPAKTAPVNPSPSTTATPSKAPSKEEPSLPAKSTETIPDASTPANPETAESTSEPNPMSTGSPGEPSTKDGPPVSSETTLAMAMRQAGFEAAKKAGDAKTKARQEELEKFKAKSTDLQKSNQSNPSEISPPSGAADAEVDKNSEDSTQVPSETTKDYPVTEKEEGATPMVDETEAKDTEISQSQIASAAEAEMAKSANAATTEAAEPESLEPTKVVQPESAAPSEELEPSTPEQKPPHVLNAKEAEEEANKAIIADEATHVHIAGSPPPYASPGMKQPREKDEDEENASPMHAAFKEEVEQKEAESKITPIDSKDDEPEQREDEKETEKHVEAAPDSKEVTQQQKADTYSEPAVTKDEASTAIPSTTPKDPKVDAEDEPTIAEKPEPVPASTKAAEEPPTAVTEAEDDDEEDDEDKEDAGGVGVPISKAIETSSTSAKTETEEESKHTPAILGADDPANSPKTPTKQADGTLSEEETKTQDQAAASGEEAGQSVDD